MPNEVFALSYSDSGIRRSEFEARGARHHSIASNSRTNGLRDLCVSRNSAR